MLYRSRLREPHQPPTDQEDHIADAAAQLFSFVKGDKRSALFTKNAFF
jgi:hypothetical protein